MSRFIALLLAFGLTFSATAASIAKVDVQKVLLTVDEGKKVRETLKKKFDEKQKIIKKEEDKIMKMRQDFEKQSLVMNDKAKLKKQKEIQGLIIALQQKTQEFQQEIQKQENDLKRPILEKVKKVIDTYSEKQNFDLVFEFSTSPIYAKGAKDITDEIVKAFNKK